MIEVEYEVPIQGDLNLTYTLISEAVLNVATVVGVNGVNGASVAYSSRRSEECCTDCTRKYDWTNGRPAAKRENKPRIP
jgi:hypothetical protein